MKIPSNRLLPNSNGEKFPGEVPSDGLLNEKSLLIPPELEFFNEFNGSEEASVQI